MENKKVLLVKDNANDMELTKRPLKKSHILNGLIVADDGVEALKFFWER